jgi:hypothetical protein
MNLTPTQKRIIDVLQDGHLHTKEELWACLNDELSGPSALRMHLSLLRKVIRPGGRDVITRVARGKDKAIVNTTYQLVHMLASANDGRK